MVSRVRIGLSLSLSGECAAKGRQAEAALRLLVDDINQSGGIRAGARAREAALECLDDAGDPAQCAAIYRSLCFENRADLLLGPCSSRLTRVAAPVAERAAMLMLNHGGAHDELHARGYRMLVGVPSPATEHLAGFVRLLARLKLWRKRLAIVKSGGRGFAQAVAEGVERACEERAVRRRGVRVRVRYAGRFDSAAAPASLFPLLARNHVNALISAGNYAHDVAVMRAVAASPLDIVALACVGAQAAAFGRDLGEHAEGIVGASQWEAGIESVPEIGPAPDEFARRMRARAPAAGCDCPAAQAYAAGLLAKAAIETVGALDQQKLRQALSDLRTSTLFGNFAIDRVTGLQVGHQMLLVQWHGGRKVVIEPAPLAESGALEFPSGWRLILASFQMLRLSRGRRDERTAAKDDESA